METEQEAKQEQEVTPDQQSVLDLAGRGASFCFTGAAGTGKSYLIERIKKILGNSSYVYVVAPTGLAAANVGGTTIHSWSGFGVAEMDVDERAERIFKNKATLARWRSCRTLIIDEVSMLSVEMFEDLSEVGKILRGRAVPFGGIQVILCGDFFQLPPISKREGEVKYCFESPLWDKLITKTIELKKNFRQESGDFLSALNLIRLGETSDHIVDLLKPRFVTEFTTLVRDGVEPTKLYAVNESVDAYNESKLEELIRKTGEERKVFLADDYNTDRLTSLLIPKRVELCVGVQVMLLYNIGDGLCNGLLGTVTSFTELGNPMVRFIDCSTSVPIMPIKLEVFEGKRVVASRRQIPLRLG